MKILMIMPWIKQGGAELIAAQTACQLQKQGHQVRLAACYVDTSQMEKEARQIAYFTFEPILGRLFKKNKFFLYFFGPFFLFWLVLKETIWADILFPHSLPSHWIASVVGRLYRKKVVWLCNEPPKRKKLAEVGFADWLMWFIADSFLDKFLVRGVDKVIVYSNGIAREVKQRYGKKATVVRLGVDFNFFSKSDKEKALKLKKRYHLDSKFILLMVGKLHPQKNQRLGIEVLKRILSKIPQAILVLVGEGPDKEKLKVKSEKLKVEDKVIFAGFCSPELVRAWYTACDLVLFPSVGQTAMVGQSWGFVPFEALCQKKISIVSKGSGAAEVLEREKINVVCQPTLGDFSQAVLDFFEKRKEYKEIGKRGYAWVKENLSWEKYGKRIGKIIEEVAKKMAKKRLRIVHFELSEKSRSLKIAIFHLGFFFSGGGEKLVLEEAAGLTKRGHQVTLFAPVIDKEDCFPDLIKKAKVHSLFFPFSFNFPLRDFLAIAGAVFLTPLTFWRFAKFDVFFGANQPGPLICFFLAKILGKPYVIYLAQPTRLIYPRKVDQKVGFGKGSFDIFYFLARIFKPIVAFLDRISIQNADAILANGDYIAKILEKVYKRKVIVCPAGCYPEKRLPSFVERWQDTIKIGKKRIQKPFILLTNRHFPQKKFEYAIMAIPRVLEVFPQVCLVVTGSLTAYTDYLKNLVRQLSLEDKVFFTDFIPERLLQKLYSQAAVYVYTSPEEDFGMGVIEAMACRTPVVAWNNAGPTTTVVDGKTGFLAKPDDIADFGEKIKKLLLDKELNQNLGRAGWKRAKEKFSYNKHNQILERVLLEAI